MLHQFFCVIIQSYVLYISLNCKEVVDSSGNKVRPVESAIGSDKNKDQSPLATHRLLSERVLRVASTVSHLRIARQPNTAAKMDSNLWINVDLYDLKYEKVYIKWLNNFAEAAKIARNNLWQVHES